MMHCRRPHTTRTSEVELNYTEAGDMTGLGCCGGMLQMFANYWQCSRFRLLTMFGTTANTGMTNRSHNRQQRSSLIIVRKVSLMCCSMRVAPCRHVRLLRGWGGAGEGVKWINKSDCYKCWYNFDWWEEKWEWENHFVPATAAQEEVGGGVAVTGLVRVVMVGMGHGAGMRLVPVAGSRGA